MFFIRTTLLLGLAVLVLPTDPASQAKVFAGAKTATQWTLTFCDRNPQSCVQGQQAWAVFVQKAKFGAEMAYKLATERVARATEAPGVAATPAQLERRATIAAPRSTLKAGDLEPVWLGPTPRKGG